MRVYNYTYIEEEEYFKVLVTRLDVPSFLKEVLIDNSIKALSQTKRYSKQFNITKLGENEAMKQAVEWLKKKRSEFGYV